MPLSTRHTRLTLGMGGVIDGRVVSLVVKPHQQKRKRKGKKMKKWRVNG